MEPLTGCGTQSHLLRSASAFSPAAADIHFANVKQKSGLIVFRLRVFSFCSLELVEETQKSSGEVASESMRDCYPKIERRSSERVDERLLPD